MTMFLSEYSAPKTVPLSSLVELKGMCSRVRSSNSMSDKEVVDLFKKDGCPPTDGLEEKNKILPREENVTISLNIDLQNGMVKQETVDDATSLKEHALFAYPLPCADDGKIECSISGLTLIKSEPVDVDDVSSTLQINTKIESDIDGSFIKINNPRSVSRAYFETSDDVLTSSQDCRSKRLIKPKFIGREFVSPADAIIKNMVSKTQFSSPNKKYSEYPFLKDIVIKTEKIDDDFIDAWNAVNRTSNSVSPAVSAIVSTVTQIALTSSESESNRNLSETVSKTSVDKTSPSKAAQLSSKAAQLSSEAVQFSSKAAQLSSEAAQSSPEAAQSSPEKASRDNYVETSTNNYSKDSLPPVRDIMFLTYKPTLLFNGNLSLPNPKSITKVTDSPLKSQNKLLVSYDQKKNDHQFEVPSVPLPRFASRELGKLRKCVKIILKEMECLEETEFKLPFSYVPVKIRGRKKRTTKITFSKKRKHIGDGEYEPVPKKRKYKKRVSKVHMALSNDSSNSGANFNIHSNDTSSVPTNDGIYFNDVTDTPCDTDAPSIADTPCDTDTPLDTDAPGIDDSTVLSNVNDFNMMPDDGFSMSLNEDTTVTPIDDVLSGAKSVEREFKSPKNTQSILALRHFRINKSAEHSLEKEVINKLQSSKPSTDLVSVSKTVSTVSDVLNEDEAAKLEVLTIENHIKRNQQRVHFKLVEFNAKKKFLGRLKSSLIVKLKRKINQYKIDHPGCSYTRDPNRKYISTLLSLGSSSKPKVPSSRASDYSSTHEKESHMSSCNTSLQNISFDSLFENDSLPLSKKDLDAILQENNVIPQSRDKCSPKLSSLEKSSDTISTVEALTKLFPDEIKDNDTVSEGISSSLIEYSPEIKRAIASLEAEINVRRTSVSSSNSSKCSNNLRKFNGKIIKKTTNKIINFEDKVYNYASPSNSNILRYGLKEFVNSDDRHSRSSPPPQPQQLYKCNPYSKRAWHFKNMTKSDIMDSMTNLNNSNNSEYHSESLNTSYINNKISNVRNTSSGSSERIRSSDNHKLINSFSQKKNPIEATNRECSTTKLSLDSKNNQANRVINSLAENTPTNSSGSKAHTTESVCSSSAPKLPENQSTSKKTLEKKVKSISKKSALESLLSRYRSMNNFKDKSANSVSQPPSSKVH